MAETTTPDLAKLAEESAAADTAPDLTGKLCPVCNLPIISTGRGRPPKVHPECKGSAKPSGGVNNDAPRKSAGSWPQAAAVENALNDLFSYAGMGLMLVNPADATIVAQGGPAVTKALVDLGRTDKKLRRYLELLAAPGKYGPLTMAVLGIVVPVMVNHNLIPQIQLFGASEKGENL